MGVVAAISNGPDAFLLFAAMVVAIFITLLITISK